MGAFIIRDTTAIYIVTGFGVLLTLAATIGFIVNTVNGSVEFVEFIAGVLSGGAFVLIGFMAWDSKKKDQIGV